MLTHEYRRSAAGRSAGRGGGEEVAARPLDADDGTAASIANPLRVAFHFAVHGIRLQNVNIANLYGPYAIFSLRAENIPITQRVKIVPLCKQIIT